jgi:dTMP kinase
VCLRLARGLRGCGVDVRRERASEQHDSEDHERNQLDCRHPGDDERGSAPGADELDVRDGRIHGGVIRADGARSSPAPGGGRAPVLILGVFVSIEGVDGSGKSTQARLLEQHLRGLGRDVVATREPGGTELGEAVRQLVLNGPEMTDWAEAALFAAARAEHAAEVIRPALGRGADVVCDRFVDSSLAYQGIARGLGLEPVLQLNRTVLEGLLPDRTFVLALDAGAAGARRRGYPDRIEREGDAFQARVGEAYQELAQRFAERIELLDGSRPAEEIAAVVRGRVEGLL